jgi:hypothetical protein
MIGSLNYKTKLFGVNNFLIKGEGFKYLKFNILFFLKKGF